MSGSQWDVVKFASGSSNLRLLILYTSAYTGHKATVSVYKPLGDELKNKKFLSCLMTLLNEFSYYKDFYLNKVKILLFTEVFISLDKLV